MRAWILTLAAVLALSVVAVPRSAILHGQEKGGDDYTGSYNPVAGWPKPSRLAKPGQILGSTSGIWAETPNKIFVLLDRGATRALEIAPVTLTITHNGDDLTFESTMSDGWVRTLKFNLKFEYTVNPLPPGGDGGEPRLNGPTKTRGRWMGERLFLHLTQGLGQRRDILTMSGNVLSIQRDYETPGGAGTMYLTFNKVS